MLLQNVSHFISASMCLPNQTSWCLHEKNINIGTIPKSFQWGCLYIEIEIMPSICLVVRSLHDNRIWYDLLPMLQWHHNEHYGISNHQPHNCLLKCRSQKPSKLHVIGLCEGNSPVTSEFPTQRASNVENVSIRWRHHEQLKHTVHTIVSWPNPKHWQMSHISDLMMKIW